MSSLNRLQQESKRLISQAQDAQALESLRIQYLGRKGELTLLLRSLGDLPPDKKKELGQQANLLKSELEQLLEEKASALKKSQQQSALSKTRDLSLPGRTFALGTVHPLTTVTWEILEIFESLGFQRAEGPEVELEAYNFEALNFPKEHPSRDAQDTFYLKDFPDRLLRTHTSPVQIRTMKSYQPPLRIVAPGRVYRHEAIDATHSAVFHQVEGFAVDPDVTFADLKGILTIFAQRMFGPHQATRFRPSFFPFTEPSAEVDVRCFGCGGKGCRICKGSGWIELMGAGLIHPNVFQAVGYDPESISGYAFGMGVERIAMLRYGVTDMRMFYENDMRFLEQF